MAWSTFEVGSCEQINNTFISTTRFNKQNVAAFVVRILQLALFIFIYTHSIRALTFHEYTWLMPIKQNPHVMHPYMELPIYWPNKHRQYVLKKRTNHKIKSLMCSIFFVKSAMHFEFWLHLALEKRNTKNIHKRIAHDKTTQQTYVYILTKIVGSCLELRATGYETEMSCYMEPKQRRGDARTTTRTQWLTIRNWGGVDWL